MTEKLLPTIFVVFLAACSINRVEPSQTEGLPIGAMETGVVATASQTLTSTPEPTWTPTVTPTLAWPVSLQTPMPEVKKFITVDNIPDLQPVVQWGEGQPYSLQLNIDGSQVFYVSSTGLKVFEAQTLELVNEINLDIPGQLSINWALSDDGSYFALMDLQTKDELNIYNTTTGKKIYSRDLGYIDVGCPFDHGDLKFSPTNNILLIDGYCSGYPSASRVLTIHISNPQIIEYPGGAYLGLFSPDGQFLAMYIYNQGVKVYDPIWGNLIGDLDTGTSGPGCVRQFSRKTNIWVDLQAIDKSNCLAFSPDSSYLAVGKRLSTMLFGMDSMTLEGEYASGRPMFSKDGKYLFLTLPQYQSRIIDYFSNFYLNYAYTLDDAAVGLDGSRVIGAISRELKPHYWTTDRVGISDLETGKTFKIFSGYSSYLYGNNTQHAVVFTAGSLDYQSPLVVDMETGEVTQTLEGESDPVLSKDGSVLVTQAGENVRVRLVPFDEIIAEIEGFYPYFNESHESIYLITYGMELQHWSLEGELLGNRPMPVAPQQLTTLSDGSLLERNYLRTRILDAETLLQQTIFPAGAVISADAEIYAIKGLRGIDIIRTETGELINNFPIVDFVEFYITPGNTYLIVNVDRSIIEAWDIQDGSNIGQLSFTGRLSNIAFAPDDSSLLGISWANEGSSYYYSLRGWSLDGRSWLPSGDYTCSPDRISNGSVGVAYSLDGRFLAYSTQDCRTDIFDLESVKVIATLDETGVDLAFSPDNSILAISTNYSGFSFWDINNNRMIRRVVDNLESDSLFQVRNSDGYSGIAPRPQWESTIGFSSDGRYFFRTADGEAFIWSVKSD